MSPPMMTTAAGTSDMNDAKVKLGSHVSTASKTQASQKLQHTCKLKLLLLLLKRYEVETLCNQSQ